MFVRWLILTITIDTICFQCAYFGQLVGGLQKSYNNELKTELVNLARQQLNSNTQLASKPIRVLEFYSQIVAGTNYWLIFIVGEEQKCKLTAYKPLPYTHKPIQVTFFKCDNITSINQVTKNNH
ncbi:unnamed protein product [Rotaria sp. Silwood1]|nr:unnamed protein product [Rotaria sp. Silwood1]CAF0964948.1 unnamed protein product [Rotaria sp. Silwood1]CAF3381216.1 unnamed protein product [Rotaria sp. Silwood1]CAF4736545.1 unnamed protein product [Rotaria sp. Silwood1]